MVLLCIHAHTDALSHSHTRTHRHTLTHTLTLALRVFSLEVEAIVFICQDTLRDKKDIFFSSSGADCACAAAL